MSKHQLLIISSICLAGVLTGLLIYWKIYYNKNTQISSLCPIQEEIRTVRGDSLEPLVPAGSKIKVLFGYYDCHEIKRNDLVLYHYGGDKDPLLKIAKGLPGDSFHLILNQNNEYNLLINDKIVVNSQGKPYVFFGNRYKMLKLYENDYQGIIPPHTYLLLGDQINGSIDAGFFGLVDRSDIIGKAEK